MENKGKTNRIQLEKQVRAKVGAEERAFRIVEKLALLDCVTETELEKMVNLVMPAHYSDVIEERSVSRICSYPLCNKKMEKITKQKYHISTKTNKVYDISQSKCFCSNFCYHASKFLESQIPTSPMWTRENISLPKITFLQRDEKGKVNEGRCLTGDQLFPAKKLTEKEIENPTKDEIISNASELDDDLQSIEDIFVNDQSSDSSNEKRINTYEFSDLAAKSGSSIDSCNVSTSIKKRIETKVKHVSVEKTLDMITHLCNILQEWCTIDTKWLLSSGFSKTKCCNSGSNEKTEKMTTKLDHRFMNRQTEEIKEQDDVERKTRISDSGDKSDSVELLSEVIERKLKVEETDGEFQEPQQPRISIIPPVDSRSQMTIRRRIVSQKLQSRFTELLPSFGLTSNDVSSELNSLIKTFSFSSHNIVLKPTEWSVISLVLLQILTKQRDGTPTSSEETHEAVNKTLQRLNVSNENFCKLEAILLPDTAESICSNLNNSQEHDFEELD